MVNYNPKDWLKFIFNFHKADTFRTLTPMIIVVSFYSAGVAYLETEVWKLSQDSHVKNLPVMHSLLGFVISMLLVFRTNTAYDRWWEGRRQWGSLVNCSRNLAIKISAFVPEGIERNFFRTAIPAYASALKNHLQSSKSLDEISDGDNELWKHLSVEKHVPNQIAAMIFKRVNHLHKEGTISGDQLIVINNELTALTDICGACERIKNTPIPFSYSIFLKKFITIYVLTLPFGYVFTLGYYVIPVVAFIFYVLASLELIAEEIEEPFGKDANDLPMDKIAQNIRKNVVEII